MLGRRVWLAAVCVLIAGHLWPPHGGPAPLLWGALPWDLTWHVGWMAAAMAAVWVMTTRRFWPDAPADPAEPIAGPSTGSDA